MQLTPTIFSWSVVCSHFPCHCLYPSQLLKTVQDAVRPASRLQWNELGHWLSDSDTTCIQSCQTTAVLLYNYPSLCYSPRGFPLSLQYTVTWAQTFKHCVAETLFPSSLDACTSRLLSLDYTLIVCTLYMETWGIPLSPASACTKLTMLNLTSPFCCLHSTLKPATPSGKTPPARSARIVLAAKTGKLNC